MAIVINNVTVADQYPNGPGAGLAIIAWVWDSNGGYATISSNDVFLQLAQGDQGAEEWGDEIHVPAGGLQLLPGTIGIRFRNFTPGSPAIVSGAIFSKSEPTVIIGSTGQAKTAGVASLNFQHNDAAVATENTMDLEDQATFLTWSMADDPPNTRVKITPVRVQGFAGAFQPANTATTTSGPAVMMGLGSTIKATPATTGRLLVIISIGKPAFSGAALGWNLFQLRHSTGAAPAFGAAAVGTLDVDQANGLAASPSSMTIAWVVTGLTIGTQYWFDIATNANNPGVSTTGLDSIVATVTEIA